MDGREETCSYTTTSSTSSSTSSSKGGRWWRLGLGSLTSVGRVSLTLAGGVQELPAVYLLAGQELRHCQPLQQAGKENSQGDSDRQRFVTDCAGEDREHWTTV